MKWSRQIIEDFTFDREEAKILLHCLDYSYHRITKHSKGIADPKKVDKIREEIRMIFDEFKTK